MKKVLLLCIITLPSLFSFAQNNTSSITGKIIENDGKSIQSATVVLLKAKDSSLVKSAVTNNTGSFIMNNIKAGSYFLSATSVGHLKNLSDTFMIAEGYDFASPAIILSQSNESLKAVNIVAKKPIIEVKADKTIFNVESSINATGSNAFELLQKSPGVSTDKDDNIFMQGKNGVKVYIDGKPSQMSGADLAAYLKSVNSADIESIEMITNPSAKYDASGNAGIINIKLKKNKNYGLNGNIASGVAIGHFVRSNSSLSFNYRNKKVNLFSNYSNTLGKNRNDFNLYRLQNDTIYDQKSYSISDNKSHNIKAGLDYFLNEKSTLGAVFTGNFNTNSNYTSSSTLITPENTGKLNRILNASNSLPGTRTNVDYNINYRYVNKGSELDVDADLINFRRKGNSYQPNYYVDPLTGIALSSDIYKNNTPTDIDIYILKADYEQDFKKGKLGYGAKYTDVKTDNTFDFYNVYGSTDVKDLNRSNKFKYDENVNSLYINYNRSLNKKIAAQAGVRLENTISEGNLESYVPQPDDNVKRNYTDFFPSGAITYTFNQKNSFNLNYSRRIDRPSYQDLNPFEDKLDELTYRKGNAFLKPQYTNSFQLSHTYNYRYVTSVGYSHIRDYFAQIIDTSGNRSFITQKNLAQQNIFSLNFSAPITITKWWNAFATFNGYHSAYKADFGTGKTIDINVNAFSIYTQESFTVKKGPTFELTGFFNSPTVWGGTFKSKALGFMDAGVQQPLFKKTATLKLTYTDIFNTLHWQGTSNYGGSTLTASGHGESRQIKINFSYRFGNSQVKAARQRKGVSDEESKRLNGGGGIGGQ